MSMQAEVSARPKFFTDCYVATHVGFVRQNNEDSAISDPKAGLLLLADGMGGHAGGEVASSTAVNEIYKTLKRSGLDLDPIMALTRAFKSASNILLAMGNGDHTLRGMGTTMVVAALKGTKLWVAHTGDSRLYMRRGNVMYRITEDHGGDGMGLLRALGCSVTTDCTPEVNSYTAHRGDMLFLCSDGLSGPLGGDGIDAMTRGITSCKAACERLIDATLSAGAPDNVTIVAGRIA